MGLLWGLAGCSSLPEVELTAKGQRPAATEIKASFLNSNEDYNLEKLKGKVVVMDFWATWCGPCRMEIPSFIKIYNTYHSKGLEILGLSVESQDKQGRDYFDKFISGNGMNYPVGLVSPETSQAYRINAIPATFFVDKEGKIATTFVGTHPEKEISAVVEKLLAE